MPLTLTPVQLAALLRRLLITNECGGDPSVALEFSDPDGVRSGKSGYSFGISQFDLLNNPTAATCLRACGFSESEILALKKQTVGLDHLGELNGKLRKAARVIEQFDELQLSACLTRAQSILAKHGITASDDAGILALADYHNQYYLSDLDKAGYLVHYLGDLPRPFTAADILGWKLNHTEYGRTHPNDCKRRYNNLIDLMKEKEA